MSKVRDLLIERIREDLMGPIEDDEVISDYPSDRYLTGILYPTKAPFPADYDEEMGEEGLDNCEVVADEQIRVTGTMSPSVAGLSFVLKARGSDSCSFKAAISCSRYIPDSLPKDDDDESSRKRPKEWIREGLSAEVLVTVSPKGTSTTELNEYGIEGISLRVRSVPWVDQDAILVTAVLVNDQVIEESLSRDLVDQKTFFQVGMEILPGAGCVLIARPVYSNPYDEDGATNALLYRNAVEFATGHTCSASWEEHDPRLQDGIRTAKCVNMDWLPVQTVPSVSPDGDIEFTRLKGLEKMSPLSARWLAGEHASHLAGISQLVNCYEEWINRQSKADHHLSSEMKDQAEKQITLCQEARDRIAEATQLLSTDRNAMSAFRLANQAMLLQRTWSMNDKGADLIWRPFQIAFFLMSLPSLCDPEHECRDVMDLLWFPTGGGKTEAYLGILAFLFFYRRLKHGEDGQGVSAIMRYTLRLLTVQQFQRASAMVLACELIRRKKYIAGDLADLDFGQEPFSIGLWVGSGSTPNKYKDAVQALDSGDESTPRQLTKCPCCKNELTWESNDSLQSIRVTCNSVDCDLKSVRPLPVWTVDEDIYRTAPSLVVGTVDKFAQITRNSETVRLFGIGTPQRSPDLILQDELHLISGPLGTMTAIYETTIDELCRESDGSLPKIIGSTATIRRASEQILSIFNRRAKQFPPPAIDAGNSGFAVEDPGSPGRVYLGVTTAGRSAKFSLQAVSGSILLSANSQASDPSIDDADVDPYWTMVVYFNSLRELGGAFVLMQDDVPDAIDLYRRYRSENSRNLKPPVELTSRVASSEIPEILNQLEERIPGDAEDVLLASNMISVGVDIPRLGVMVVNGQPKTMSEYIQATSRVGRGVPGFIVSIFNAYKPRDRAHYESFKTWHSALYRDVEATSVTPFAPRARDRALHTAFVAAVRALVPGFLDDPTADLAQHRVAEIIDVFVQRAEKIDLEEAVGVREYLERCVLIWQGRQGTLKKYWNDYRPETSLMISAEKAASLAAQGLHTGGAWSAPNSMRSVEPGTEVELI